MDHILQVPLYLHTYICTCIPCYLPTYLSIYLSTYLLTYLPTYPPTYKPRYSLATLGVQNLGVETQGLNHICVPTFGACYWTIALCLVIACNTFKHKKMKDRKHTNNARVITVKIVRTIVLFCCQDRYLHQCVHRFFQQKKICIKVF